jgi:nicotinamidase-related amidase
VVIKKRFSGFYGTALQDTLCERDVDTLFIAGYSSDVCVRMTTMDAYNRDYDLYLLSDCVHADREDTDESIRYLAWLTNLRPITNDELAAILEGYERAEGV